MITEIGIIAGEIWHCLEKKGRMSLSLMVEELKRDREVILMSLGWLAREGHVVVERDYDYLVSLRK